MWKASRKSIIFCLFFIGTFVWSSMFPMNAEAVSTSDLQSMVDSAKPGDTITVPSGTYEGPIIISKPLKIQTNGDVQIVSTDDKPALLIQADNVQLSDITILDQRHNPDSTAVLLQGNENQLLNIRITTQGTALKLQEAHRNKIENIRIEGAQDSSSAISSYLYQGHGIDLWGSHDNFITGSHISGVQDGIYIESSESNQIIRNHVSNSRYGFHIMFTHDTTLQENESVQNVTGAMIMEADRSQVIDNRFIKSNANVHSEGVLLFNTKNAVVTKNRIEGNRLGIYVEQSTDNEIVENQIVQNFIGIQMLNSENNLFYRNNLICNVIQAQAGLSSNNRIHENYWDDHQGIDFSGNGRSSLPYKADPFFLTVANSVPPFQLFFQSPGMLVLEEIFKNDTENWMTDGSPLMRPASSPSHAEPAGSKVSFVVSSILFLISAIPFFKKGVVRK